MWVGHHGSIAGFTAGNSSGWRASEDLLGKSLRQRPRAESVVNPWSCTPPASEMVNSKASDMCQPPTFAYAASKKSTAGAGATLLLVPGQNRVNPLTTRQLNRACHS